jgi:hypothetical protein
MDEQDLRKAIAAQILAKFGGLAPYAMVAEFVKTHRATTQEGN